MAAYSELATLVASSAFQDRVRFAVTFYAQYILGEDPATNNHTSRASWAKGAYQNPAGVAGGLLYAIALDGTIQTQLGAATDAQMQSATEAAINTVLKF